MSPRTGRRRPLFEMARFIGAVGAVTLVVVGVSATAATAAPPVAPGTTDYFSTLTSTAVFSPSGTWAVPLGVTSVEVSVIGAPGAGATAQSAAGGHGSVVTGDLAVSPGQVLTRQVGTAGSSIDGSGGTGYGAGGAGSNNCGAFAGGGGGSSALFADGIVAVVAAGGGGGGFQDPERTDAGVGGDADLDNAGSGEATPGSLGRSGSADGGDGNAGSACVGGGGGGGGGPVSDSALSGGGTGGGAGSPFVGSGGGGGGGVSFHAADLTNATVAPDITHPNGVGDPGVTVSFRMRVTVPTAVTVTSILNPPVGGLPSITVSGCALGADQSLARIETTVEYFVSGLPFQTSIELQRGGPATAGVLSISFESTIEWFRAHGTPPDAEIMLSVSCPEMFDPVTVVIPHGGDIGASLPVTPTPVSTPSATPVDSPSAAPAAAAATLANTGAGLASPLGALLAGALLLVSGALALVVPSRRRRHAQPSPRR
ncbi:hypothetical protein KPL76_01595 [Subtercola sp. PAMC28395]|uniref:hypothetical protein n=1 Tax=Subtercola sp. PAMC28395 TaxID=2846775 RepID=UPI001C0E47F5|nr:hypothetical protein [Subtercola sp. PAMC28395]QWT24155.1 hypothetical protein KPL76_01595 [Subtercola sp. PAMC28395]